MNRVKRNGLSVIVAISLLVTPIHSGVSYSTAEAKSTASIVVNQKIKFNLKSVPQFKKDRPYVIVNGNKPYFKKKMLAAKNFEEYSELDRLGR